MNFKTEYYSSICNGYRLKAESLCIKVAGLNIGEVTKMTIVEAKDWFERLEFKLSSKQLFIVEQF